MNILYVVSALSRVSGVTTFIDNVVAELRKQGHRVDICTVADQHFFSTDTIKSAYSLVHIHGLWFPFLHKASCYAVRHSIPVVWSTHGMTAPWSLHHKWWKKFLPWYLYQKPDLKHAALIHCTTDLEADWNHALGFTNTFIAPLGTNLPAVMSSVPLDRGSGASPIAPAARTLLYVGRIYPVKALDNAIRAIALMKQSIKLRIVGPDQAGHQSELEKLASDLGVRDKIDFVGPRYEDELSAEYDDCDGLILVSHTENFGATVVDAMAHGKPVITSTKTPWKIVADKNCGWWVDNDSESLSKSFDAFASISTSDLNLLGQNGLALVKQSYTWPAIVSNLISQYERVIRHD